MNYPNRQPPFLGKTGRREDGKTGSRRAGGAGELGVIHRGHWDSEWESRGAGERESRGAGVSGSGRAGGAGERGNRGTGRAGGAGERGSGRAGEPGSPQRMSLRGIAKRWLSNPKQSPMALLLLYSQHTEQRKCTMKRYRTKEVLLYNRGRYLTNRNFFKMMVSNKIWR